MHGHGYPRATRILKCKALVLILVRVTTPLAFGQMESHDSSPSQEMGGAFYGAYSMNREASGTSWQPEATPMGGIHIMKNDWLFMIHGFANMIYDRQGGPRGDDDFFSSNMLMIMGNRRIGPGIFGMRAMMTLEPATISRSGYPELLQTGETADGKTPLIDHQHPHDLFMELALSYSVLLGDDASVFAYFGLPGEPALGPPTFMHRFSGMDDPEAPITHHWLDSTHVTYGVATAGFIWKQFKLDGSIFTGREPDQNRWDIERPRFDSQSVRLSWNPNEHWALQASYGWLNSPEQLEPDVDTQRATASVSYHVALGEAQWQSTFAWGRNQNRPGHTLDAFLLESAVVYNKMHTVFVRGERVDKDEIFPPGDPRDGEVFTVNKVSLGYIYDFAKLRHVAFGVGGLGSAYVLPASLKSTYGDTPLSFMLFVRAKL